MYTHLTHHQILWNEQHGFRRKQVVKAKWLALTHKWLALTRKHWSAHTYRYDTMKNIPIIIYPCMHGCILFTCIHTAELEQLHGLIEDLAISC